MSGQFCAICVSERGPFQREPLGPGYAMVWVCASCREEMARVDDGPDRSYESTGGLPTGQSVTEAAHRLVGKEEWARLSRLEDELARSCAPAMSEEDRLMKEVTDESHRRRRTGAARAAGPKSSKEKGVVR